MRNTNIEPQTTRYEIRNTLYEYRESRYLRTYKAKDIYVPIRHPSTLVENPLQIVLFLQNKPNFRKAKMNVNSLITMNYKKTNLVLSEVEWAKTNPISSKAKMNLKSLAGKSCLSSLLSEHTRWGHIVKPYPFTT